MSPDSGETRLRRLGLQQELVREFSLLTNFGISFSIISILTGIGGSLSIAWNNSGPAAAIWGWKLVSVTTMLIGLIMAEIVSGLPSSGGPYFWSSWLAGKRGPFCSWITGWCNLLGQIAVTASVAFAAMVVIVSMVQLMSGHSMNAKQQLAIYGGVLVLSGLLNSTSPRYLARISAFSIFWHFSGVVFLVLLVPAVAPDHQNAKFVWATFFDYTHSTSGITNNGYLFMQGCLMAQFTIIVLHAGRFWRYIVSGLCKETKGADSTAPYAIVLSIAVSAVLGYILLIGLLMSIQDPWKLVDPEAEAGGFALGQIMYDVFYARFNSGKGGAIALGVFAIAMTLCTTASVTANSRMIYAFARDNGIPFSGYFKCVSRRTTTPVRAVWFAVVCAFVLGLPSLKSSTAFTAVISMSTMGLQVSYGIPIFLRLTVSKNTFERGPFHLGRFSHVVGWLAVFWILFSAVNFALPTTYPVNATDFNYSAVTLGLILVGASIAWVIPKYGARHYYSGPRNTYEQQSKLEYAHIMEHGGRVTR